jgi:KUP system potassium uptake protein
VTSTMLVTSILFYNIARHQWNWSRLGTALLLALFICIDLPFFGANFSKIFHGAWLPLLIGLAFFAIMWTWKSGRELLAGRIGAITSPLNQLGEILKADPPQIIDGSAVFLSGNPNVIPFALMQNLRHNKVLHRQTVILNFKVEDVPRVPRRERIQLEELVPGVFRVVAVNGFMDDVDIVETMALANRKGLSIDLANASYFLGRERLKLGEKPDLHRWASALFLVIARNASDVSSFYKIPANQVIEVGVQLEL